MRIELCGRQGAAKSPEGTKDYRQGHRPCIVAIHHTRSPEGTVQLNPGASSVNLTDDGKESEDVTQSSSYHKPALASVPERQLFFDLRSKILSLGIPKGDAFIAKRRKNAGIKNESIIWSCSRLFVSLHRQSVKRYDYGSKDSKKT